MENINLYEIMKGKTIKYIDNGEEVQAEKFHILIDGDNVSFSLFMNGNWYDVVEKHENENILWLLVDR